MSEAGVVETARMVLEPLRPEHAGELMAILLDPRVERWFRAPDAPPPSDAEVIASTARNAAEWTSHGIGYWLMRDRTTGEAVGRGGLRHIVLEPARPVDEVEVGWAVAPARWREGLATEMALAAIDYAWTVLELSELVTFTMLDNVASRRVMEKTGFAYEREILHERVPHALYRRVRC